MSKFQIITLGIFILFIIVGVAAFATYKGSAVDNQLPPITIWGTFPAETFNQYVSRINSSLPQPVSIQYVYKTQSQFSNDFISALARGQGPDAILVPADTLLPHQDKVTVIPYSAFPQRSFMDGYIEESELYMTKEGILAIPFTVDPLVMYWNRDVFAGAGIAVPPRTWDDILQIAPKLTSKDKNSNIRSSGVAMGEFGNITHARELFATLLLQTGNPITVRDSEGFVMSTLKPTYTPSPVSALNYFTQFSNPTGQIYTWSKVLPESKTMFLTGTLATYFGFASEINELRSKNPNLNFDVTSIPQVKSGGIKATYGSMYGFSIVRSTQNANVTYQIITLLASPEYLDTLSTSMYLPSVRRDVIARGSNDPYLEIFNQTALVSKTWLDIDPNQSRDLFRSMVEAVTSGRMSADQAMKDAGDRYDVLLSAVGK